MLIVVMGVTASGKTTLGRRLAERIGVPFFDADDFHPPANRAKMARNIPLDDGDRRPWLEHMAELGPEWERSGGAVLACSALKQSYRELLLRRVDHPSVVYLRIERAEVLPRLEERRGRHAIVSDYTRIIDGQFRDLEEPADAIRVRATLEPEKLVERTLRLLVRAGFRDRGRLYFGEGSPSAVIDAARGEELVLSLLESLGPMRRVLIVPPDYTRRDSGAGELSALLYRQLSSRAEVSVLPALGGHTAMTPAEMARMFRGIPQERFLSHDWRNGLTLLGEVPAAFIDEVSEGRLGYSIPCELDQELAKPEWDRIISVGQLVPHEVAGTAGHVKNVFIGAGGKRAIDRTHFLGAVCGMEAAMGELTSPVRDVLGYMASELGRSLPITHLMTVRARDETGTLRTRFLVAGDGDAPYRAGAPIARACNVERVSAPARKVVVYLDPEKFRSTWLGNKAIYRTRLAVADGGEILVLAPGIRRFGEDAGIDALIRRHGYHGTPATLEAVERDPELSQSLSAAAHLIHGSSEGRFRIRYAPGLLSREEIEGVGYEYADLASELARNSPERLRPGVNRLSNGEDVLFVDDPGLGLWTLDARGGGP
jgi:carbohydrate kinase (thermoresistant glucokinase family)